jgi:hypothetical protein
MQYPVATLEMAENYVLQMRSENQPLNTPEPMMRGLGRSILNELELKVVKSMASFKDLKRNITNAQAKDGVEGILSIEFFNSIEFLHESPEVLTDKDFWRYLSINYFYEFAEWREQRTKDTPCHLDAFGAKKKGLTRDCVPFRMFQRAYLAKMISNSGNDLSYSMIAAGDIWKSHLLGVLNSLSPAISKEILDRYEDGALNTSVVRPLAKRLKKLRANVLFEVLPSEDAAFIISREIDRSA